MTENGLMFFSNRTYHFQLSAYIKKGTSFRHLLNNISGYPSTATITKHIPLKAPKEGEMTEQYGQDKRHI